MEMQLVEEVTGTLIEAWQNKGWLAAFGTSLLFSVRLFRLDGVQGLLPAKAQWASWPMWARFLTPFALGFAGTLIVALAGKMSVATAITSAIAAGIAAFAEHKVTRAMGKAEAALRPPGYTPSALRDKLSIVVPFPKDIGPTHKVTKDAA